MCVTLPSGIAFRTTACCSIADACAAISSGVSNAMPSGGAEKPGWVGFMEWQAAQRSATIAAHARERHLPALPPTCSGGLSQIAIAGERERGRTGIAQTLRPW